MNNPALVVDLDGTLLKTDSLWECLYDVAYRKPWLVLLMPLWLLAGKAAFKHKIAILWDGSVKRWPYNVAVVAEIEKAKHNNRTTCLATAANERIARKVAEHFQLFDVVISSTEKINLKGGEKRRRLIAEFGEKGFDYIGDSRADIPVWEASRQAVVVTDRDSALVRNVRQLTGDCRRLPAGKSGIKAYLKEIRVHQWVKNALVAIPIVFLRSFTWHNILSVFLGIVCFCLLSSLIYIINDLADLLADRMHPQKKKRPFAAGVIPLSSGPVLLLLLACGIILIASGLPQRFWLILAVYFVLNLAYSWFLKRTLMLDIVVLMIFYVIRIASGDVLIAMPHSNWMIGFACFIFLGMSLIKRASELIIQNNAGIPHASGRAYRSEDQGILMSMAAACGTSSLAILALYIDSLKATRGFNQPNVLWLLCPLVGYWFGRLMLLTNRGKMPSDPVGFVLTDPVSICTMAVGVLFVLCAAI